MQLLNGALLALAVVLGAATALSLVMIAAATVTQPGQTPRGGTGRGLPEPSAPDPDDARELVLR